MSSEIVALIPLRGDGKSRLARELPDGRRERLVAAMLDDVVAALRDGGVEDIRVLAADDTAHDIAVARDLGVLRDPPPAEGAARTGSGGEARLRAAVDAALAMVPDGMARLVVAADLPRLRGAEVDAVLAAGAEVTVAPTAGGGTAVLALSRGVVIPARYGPGSADAHLAEARRLGRSAAHLDLPGARHDVDAATDLDALRRGTGPAPTGAATAAFLADVRR